MSWGAIGATVVGGIMSGGGGGGGGEAPAVQRTESFGIEGGLFGGSGFNRESGTITNAMDPRLAGIQGQGLDMAGLFNNQAMNNQNAQMFGNLGGQFGMQLGNTDPLQLQSQLYNQQASILQPQFDKQLLDQENRQFSQGTFGSTVGANQTQALLDSQNTSFGKLLSNSFQQSQMQQQQTAGLSGMFAGLDPQLRQQFQNLGTGGINQSLGIQGAGEQALQTAGQLTSSNTGGTPDSMSATQQVGAGILTAGVGGLTQGIEGLFSPSGVNQTQMNIDGMMK